MKNRRLKEARIKANMSQNQLSECLGYKGKQSVANWENGYSTPTLKVAIRLSELLGKDIRYLFGQKVQENHTFSSEVLKSN
ncbi:DNA-binding transcriptional regulator, XRE-family HTH domain [Halobacillus karajensis]|uniref:helix-turn-helix transcriptional regulator n=1 Tax=Halobacillus karajensis TaxID=195088 RepID=UPI0008A75664|nr:helix-turn-helix transcriptional regulator [Halobacillus karajensis]SEI12961.1 DNA-binding transcriptional regulator, XRE-family HTH domain [Halobacillus karajensis]